MPKQTATGVSHRRRNRLVLLVLLVAALLILWRISTVRTLHKANGFAMSTLVTQSAYGPKAQNAMRQVNEAFAAYEARLSLFGNADTGDIRRINDAAGTPGGALVSSGTADLLQHALELSAQSEDAFAITIAPLTLAWGITTDHPRVVPQPEIDALLPLVNDAGVKITRTEDAATARVELAQKGMGIDLGGFAKGAACTLAAEIYEQNQVDSALLSIGGNIYARGTKPGGAPWRIGFRDPLKGEESYIASFTATDQVVAVSGGYERYFEQDGKRYIHILDPRTGRPAESDILSVGAVHPDGATADFYSTTLFVWGKEKALEFMRRGGQAVLLDTENNLYVSESLREGFELHPSEGDDGAPRYRLVFVAPEESA